MKDNIKVFKHLLFRIASESNDVLQECNMLYLEPEYHLRKIYYLKSKQKAAQKYICDLLYDAIKIIEDKQDRQRIINVRRKIHNGKKINFEPNFKSLNLYSNEVEQEYKAYCLISSQIESATEKLKEKYKQTYQGELALISTLCKSDKFKSGLLLSSKTLYKYACDLNFKNKKSVLGFWKYITRVIAKTTPFSTFTNINLGLLVDNSSIVVNNSNSTLRSAIKYNNYILQLILSILKSSQSLNKGLKTTINPSLTHKHNSLSFFTNDNNIESIQTIGKNDTINFILDILDRDDDITVANLSTELSNAANTSIADAHSYIAELTRIGLLQIDLSISGLDDQWVGSLSRFIKEGFTNDDDFYSISEKLDKLSLLQIKYCKSHSSSRFLILQDIEDLFSDIIKIASNYLSDEELENKTKYITNGEKSEEKIFLHNMPNGKINLGSKNVIYEDSTKDLLIHVNKKQITDFIAKINLLISSLSEICKVDTEQQRIYELYKKNYQDDQIVPLLEFYEKNYKESTVKPHSNNGELWRKIRSRIKTAKDAGEISYSNNECHVAQDFILKLSSELNLKGRNKGNNYSAFIQFYYSSHNREELLNGVINGGIMPGRGKLVGRFLYLFDKSVTVDLQKWNKEDMSEGKIFVENSDASFFNANLHANLMPYEINMPGGNTRLNDRMVNVTDLFVKVNDETQKLELTNKNGDEVSVYDLGFETLFRRSNLYKLLCTFSQNMGCSLYSITTFFNESFSYHVSYSGLTIIVYPRIVYDNVVILQRKKWHVPIELFKMTLADKAKLADEEIYINVQNWREKLEIPQKVFLRVRYDKNNAGNPINQDYYKPQAINFLSPVSVLLFIKIAGKVFDGILILEEELPKSEDGIKINDSIYANETLVNWKN